MLFVGQFVSTPYGEGVLQEMRDCHAVVEPVTWEMDRKQKATFFINQKDILPYFSVGDLVSTVYGRGRIDEIREADAIYIVTLDHWKLAQGQSPTLYLQAQALSRRKNEHLKGISVATKVITPYGNGLVTAIRERDQIVIVRPDNWIMADGKPPQFFLNPSFVKPINSSLDGSSTNKSDEASVGSKIKRCIELKNNGSNFFKKKDFENAKVMYTNALTVLQYIGENLSNDEKAAVMEQSVPCHNNMALCSLKLNKWADCVVYAKNAIMLISALESQIPLGSKVWECLQARKLTMDTLLKKWKKRSYYLAAKGYSGSLELNKARENFKMALDLIEGDSEYVKEANDLKKLITETKKKIVRENKLEKKMWSKAFSGVENSDSTSEKPNPSVKEEGETAKSDEIDLSEFGLPSSGGQKKEPTSSTVAKKSPLPFWGGALAVFATFGLIVGFSYFRLKKR